MLSNVCAIWQMLLVALFPFHNSVTISEYVCMILSEEVIFFFSVLNLHFCNSVSSVGARMWIVYENLWPLHSIASIVASTFSRPLNAGSEVGYSGFSSVGLIPQNWELWYIRKYDSYITIPFMVHLQGRARERLLSCEKVLPGCTWLVLSKTGPFSAKAWQFP